MMSPVGPLVHIMLVRGSHVMPRLWIGPENPRILEGSKIA